MSSSEDLFDDDLALAQACIAGQPEAFKAFEAKFHAPLCGILIKLRASTTLAEDLVRDLLSDCLISRSGKEPQLCRYNKGESSLQGWLRRCAINKLKDHWRHEEVVQQNAGKIDFPSSGGPSPSEANLIALLRRALKEGLAACPAEGRLMLQLVYIEGLTQREICRMWNCHESTVSRRFKDAMETIQTATLAKVRQQDPYLVLEWEDFLELCETSRSGLPW